MKKTSKPIVQYSLSGRKIKEFVNAAETAAATGSHPSQISGTARGVYKTAKGFKWKYKM